MTLGRAGASRVLAVGDLGALFIALQADGRRVIGPIVSDGVIAYGEIEGPEALPAGVRTKVAPGRQRLETDGGGRRFDYGQAAQSWKRFLFPPRFPLWRAVRDAGGVRFEAVEADPPERVALLGVRACELAGLTVLGRALDGPPVAESDHRGRREAALIVAVECRSAGGTCFCGTMGAGPEVRDGFDLALTELADGDFVVRVGSDAGEGIADRLPLRSAAPGEVAERTRVLDDVLRATSGVIATEGLPERLLAAPEHPRWADIAERCLTCASCTMVCPTCFCTSVEQHSDLGLMDTVAERRWESCFTEGFAAVAGGNFRPEPRDRYRQWLTHKFGTWPSQFGTFGCVGCGRCITFCPVGIDIREELAVIAGPRAAVPSPVLTAPVLPSAPAETSAGPPSRPDAAVPGPGSLVLSAQPGGMAAFTPGVIVPRPPPAPFPTGFVPATVVWAAPETADVTTLHLDVDDPAIREGAPGQFVMAALPGFPPAAISISRYHPEGIELTVRAAGPATAALGRLRTGDGLGLRGPLGRPWPMDLAVGRGIVAVAGGIGLAPLRPVIDAVRMDPERFGRLHLCYGARTPADRLYVSETFRLRRCRCMDVSQTVDRADEDWLGQVGMVPCLLENADWIGEDLVAFVCGPERMMEAVAATLLEKGIPAERIFLALERHMECGIGLCGHCQVGPYFVCRDGPVFALSEIEGILAVGGI